MMKKAPVMVWTAGIAAPEGLDASVFSVAVMVDRVDGKPLSDDDLDVIRKAFPADESHKPAVASKPAKAGATKKTTTKKRSAAKRR